MKTKAALTICPRGVASYAGGAISQTVYVTILSNVVSSTAAREVVAAVVRAGGSAQTGMEILESMHLGMEALSRIPDATTAMIEAASVALQSSYGVEIRTVSLSSIAFGVTGMIATCLCEDITPKMTSEIDVFLENDVKAERNKFH